jgi:hypothetical protein
MKRENPVPETTTTASELAAVRAELPRVDAKCSTLAGLTMAGSLSCQRRSRTVRSWSAY